MPVLVVYFFEAIYIDKDDAQGTPLRFGAREACGKLGIKCLSVKNTSCRVERTHIVSVACDAVYYEHYHWLPWRE